MTPQLREYLISVLVGTVRTLVAAAVAILAMVGLGWASFQAGIEAGFFLYVLAGYTALGTLFALTLIPTLAFGHVWSRTRLRSRAPGLFDEIGMENLYRVRMQRTIATNLPIARAREQILEELVSRGFVRLERDTFEFGYTKQGRLRPVRVRLRRVAQGTAVDVIRSPNKRSVIADIDDELQVRAFADVVRIVRELRTDS